MDSIDARSNDTIVFICNGNISNEILDWTINGDAIATYRYHEDQSFPRIISPSSMISGIEVQISSAVSENGFINFENFTLAIPPCNIATYGEVTVQCGNSLVQSNVISYELYNVSGNG